MNTKLQYRIALGLALAALVLPLLVLVLWCCTNVWRWPSLFPTEWGLRGIRYLFSPTAGTNRLLIESLALSTAVTILSLAVSIPAGRALGLHQFRGKRLAQAIIFLPVLVSPLAAGMGIHLSFIRYGLANTALGVILIHTVVCIPYSVQIMTQYFEAVGDRVEKQAQNLGAKSWQTFLLVTLPMLSPALLSAGSLVFVISFGQYFLTFLIGGGRVMTLSLVMVPFIQSGDRTVAAVYSLVFIGVTLLVLAGMEWGLRKMVGNENFYESK